MIMGNHWDQRVLDDFGSGSHPFQLFQCLSTIDPMIEWLSTIIKVLAPRTMLSRPKIEKRIVLKISLMKKRKRIVFSKSWKLEKRKSILFQNLINQEKKEIVFLKILKIEKRKRMGSKIQEIEKTKRIFLWTSWKLRLKRELKKSIFLSEREIV